MASVTSPSRPKGAVGDHVFNCTPGAAGSAYLKAHASKKKWHRTRAAPTHEPCILHGKSTLQPFETAKVVRHSRSPSRFGLHTIRQHTLPSH